MIFVISAPSGAGKTTLCKEMLNRISKLKYSVSYTTRSPRKGEKEAEDYYFISEKEFKNLIKEGKLLEYTKVASHYYGTPKENFISLYNSNYDILMELDVRGGAKLKELYPNDTVLIFILPPSLRALKERLIKRDTENSAQIQKRLKLAKNELNYVYLYDHIVSNVSLEEAMLELTDLIKNYLKKERG
jgi:guanylate kinase